MFLCICVYVWAKSNARSLGQSFDLLESYVYCDRLSIADDLIFYFDKPSDPSTALNVELDHLCLHHIVKITTHRFAHTD